VTAFEQLCRQQPGFEQLLVAALARRVEQLSGRLLDALYVSLDRRLCRCLLDLTRVYAEPDDGAEATIALTQDHLADLVGGTRPSVNQILQKLSADGIVEVRRGRVIVRDAAALRRLAAD
jgi:CRP-like cAMP-binding protein